MVRSVTCFWHFGSSLLAAIPLFADNYTIRIAISIAMFSAMALSWNFIGGFTGYPSFSTAAFFGIGCYVGALAQRAGVPMELAWVLATIFVALFAVGARRHHPAPQGPLLRHRLDRDRRVDPPDRVLLGEPDRRR